MVHPSQPIKLSLIIPLYNRPDEIDELLDSLTRQTAGEFEVIVVEDGSQVDSADIVRGYTDRLTIRYLLKENGGPGPARNSGAKEASGNYLVFLDSDCIIPEHYIQTVLEALNSHYVDAYGGPDRAHPSFTPVQKSINYSMTSLLTTGGIRGNRRSMEKFHPRSFNMGISRPVFEQLNGFAPMRFGEDVDFSMRIMEAGCSTRLIGDAYVYHKRRTDFRKFFKQVHNSGIARINLGKKHPGSTRLVHTLPSIFTLGSIFLVFSGIFWHPVFFIPLILYLLAVFIDGTFREGSAWVGILAVIAVITQLTGYGSGFIKAFWRRNILRKREFQAFEDSFYK
jgi:glycosyltransferase involved in cell wall biosynthesis